MSQDTDNEPNYIFVDVESQDSLVMVYDLHGEITAWDFISHQSLADDSKNYRVTQRPYDDACRYAAAKAKELNCEWGSNL